jgi:hypothetical protein
MGRGKGGKPGGGGSQLFSSEYTFDLFALDENGNERVPTVGNTKGIKTYTFIDAVENFQGYFKENVGGVEFQRFNFPQINITETFAGSTNRIILDAPVNLDLTARYLHAGKTLTRVDGGDVLDVGELEDINTVDHKAVKPVQLTEDRIELTLSSDELIDKGVYELTLVVEDEDKNKRGFQVGNKTINPNNPTEDLNDIESIFDIWNGSNDNKNDNSEYRLSAISAQDQNLIVSGSFNPASYTPIIIEAEEIDPNKDSDGTIKIEGFQKEDFNSADASGLSLAKTGQSQGIISFQAQDYSILPYFSYSNNDSTTYNLRIDSFDEKDGVGSIKVQVKDSSGKIELDQTITLSESTSSPVPNKDNARSYFIGELDLDPTDTITIIGTTNQNEFVRIDSLTFEPSEATPLTSQITSRPSVSRSPNVIEAEEINSNNITGYQEADFTQAGSRGLSLLGTEETEGTIKGTISLKADDYGLKGNYNLRINSFDENDGEGSIQVEVKDSSGNIELDQTITLDENTSSPFPTNYTARSYVIKDLDLDGSETITITGIADTSQADPNDSSRGGEFTRIDNLVFNPVRESFTIEAEEINPDDGTIDITGYQVDGSGLSLVGGTQGTISFQAQDYQDYDLAGEYDLRINSFDDAVGSIQVQVKNSSGNIELDQTITLNGSTDNSNRSYVIGGLDLDSTDTISIIGNADPSSVGSKIATIDSFTFEPI